MYKRTSMMGVHSFVGAREDYFGGYGGERKSKEVRSPGEERKSGEVWRHRREGA
jgi:hypothetical protein